MSETPKRPAKPAKIDAAPFVTILGNVEGKFGFGSTVVGATDARGNTILNQGGLSAGFGSGKPDATSTFIGSFSGGGAYNLAANLSAIEGSIAAIKQTAMASDSLTTEQQAAVFQQLADLEKQATLATSQTEKPSASVVKNAILTLSTLITTAGGMAEVWSTWGAQLQRAFDAVLHSASQ